MRTTKTIEEPASKQKIINFQITFPIQNGKIEFGKAKNICFGCGEKTILQKEIFFEDHDSFNPLGHLGVLMDRTSLAIPICENCNKISSYCVKKIWIWSGIFIFMVFSMLIAMEALNIGKNKDWHIFIIIGAGLLPIYKIKKYWSKKDRGGDFVKLISATKICMTLDFNNIDAYKKIIK